MPCGGHSGRQAVGMVGISTRKKPGSSFEDIYEDRGSMSGKSVLIIIVSDSICQARPIHIVVSKWFFVERLYSAHLLAHLEQ